MNITAEHQDDNKWIVTAKDEGDNTLWAKTVFCNAEKNTEADAIAEATAEPQGDI